MNAFLAQNKILTQQLENPTKKVDTLSVNAVSNTPLACDFCGGEHEGVDCPGNMFRPPAQEQVNFMNNPPRQ